MKSKKWKPIFPIMPPRFRKDGDDTLCLSRSALLRIARIMIRDLEVTNREGVEYVVGNLPGMPVAAHTLTHEQGDLLTETLLNEIFIDLAKEVNI